MKNLKIKDLNTIEEMASAFDLVSQMYSQMSFEDYISRLQEMIERNDFKMVAVYIDDEMVGVSGYWIFMMLYCGRYLQASNLIVSQNFRSQGVGKKILDYLEKKAKISGCQKVVLDSYVENKKSHPLYYREGFYIRGFHFMKDI